MKGFLLDTHIFIWWRARPEIFDPTLIKTIHRSRVVVVSAASIWEAGIKQALGKLKIPETLSAAVLDSGFDELPVRFRHADEAAKLPLHHRDPFDRMLIAQARVEELTLVSRDSTLAQYEVDLLPVGRRS